MKVSKLASAPAFLFSVFVFYWSLPYMAVTHTCFHRMRGPRQDMYLWSVSMVKFFRVRVLKYGTNKLFRPTKNVLYLCNHRSWADFFLDLYFTEGNAALMSRLIVFWVFPVFMASVHILKGIVLFKRGHIADKKKFNAWLDSQFTCSPVPGLLVYPEGHRSTLPKSLPLKRGMLHYAHSRGMPVQIVISKNKELVMSEKLLAASWGETVVVGYSEPIETAGTEFEAFAAKVNSTWDKLWEEVFSADEKTLPPLIQDDTPTFDYPMDMRVKQLVAVYLSVPTFVVTMAVCIRLGLWSTVLLGPIWQQVLFCSLTFWLIWSIMNAQGRSNA